MENVPQSVIPALELIAMKDFDAPVRGLTSALSWLEANGYIKRRSQRRKAGDDIKTPITLTKDGKDLAKVLFRDIASSI